MAKLRRFPIENACYHTVSTTRDRTPLFEELQHARIVLDSIDFVRRERAFVLAYALMPDHLHLVVVPRLPYDLAKTMQTIKGYSSRAINELMDSRGALWQPGYFDRLIRNEAQLEQVISYVHRNPVEAGLVSQAEEFAYSSAHPDGFTDLETWLTDGRG